MRSYDFTPLYRATVGFDRIADVMDRVLTTEVAQPTYPPYNIEKLDGDAYRISIAVAGFSPDELSVEVRDGSLFVLARKTAEETERKYLHRGIANRAFERRFVLADHLVVQGASIENGLLHVALQRVVPEALKPRRIQIATGAHKPAATRPVAIGQAA